MMETSDFVLAQSNPTFMQKCQRTLVQGIVQIVNNFDNAAVDDHLCAEKAGGIGGIEG